MIGISVNLKLYLVSAYLDLKPGLSPKTRLWLLLHLVGQVLDQTLFCVFD